MKSNFKMLSVVSMGLLCALSAALPSLAKADKAPPLQYQLLKVCIPAPTSDDLSLPRVEIFYSPDHIAASGNAVGLVVMSPGPALGSKYAYPGEVSAPLMGVYAVTITDGSEIGTTIGVPVHPNTLADTASFDEPAGGRHLKLNCFNSEHELQRSLDSRQPRPADRRSSCDR